jgi:hypothetical protein
MFVIIENIMKRPVLLEGHICINFYIGSGLWYGISHLVFSGKSVHEMNFWNVCQLFFLSVKCSLNTLLEKGIS